MASIPFNDLKAHHANHREAFHQALDELLDSSGFIGGKAVAEFEQKFASFCGSKYCVGVGNGTDAIVIALRGLGIGKGDLVVTVPNTFIATTEAISESGAEMLFVDVTENERTMDLDQLENLLKTHPERERIKCVIPVHLYGQPVDMPKLKSIVEPYQIKILADSAQAHGAFIQDKGIAQYADVSTFSFYPGKNLGALGDGGAIVTNDDVLEDYCRRCSNHGRSDKYAHEFEGVNSRLDALQAKFLTTKLEVLAEKTRLRQHFARLYDTQIAERLPELKRPMLIDARLSVFHLYVIQVKDRDQVIGDLKQQGIQVGIHYPIAIHQLKAYEHLNLAVGSFPIAEKLSQSILTLPLYPEMADEDITTVVDALCECKGI